MKIWAAIPGYEGRYEVSSDGDVRSIARKALHKGRWGQMLMTIPAKVMRLNDSGAGYLDVQLSNAVSSKKHHLVHRLVAAAFIGPSQLQVNHKDGKKSNNKLENLEYCTSAENIRHCIDVLGKKRGSGAGSAKFSEADIPKIRADTRPIRQIANEYQVTYQAIHAVKRGINWGHIPKESP